MQPVQRNIIKTCKRFYQVQSGDFCQKIVDQSSTFSLDRFYTWNPHVGTSCSNLQAAVYVCVGIDGTPTSPSPTANPIPSPTQAGIIKTCIRYDKTNPSGVACNLFATRIGMPLAQLHAWNPVLGRNGENCQTSFWANTYYCTSVAG
ncbi:hypothetical protein BDZ85DRAFT_94006 [Elsinoe ampelina]|uniref:LysM domain-containing protein n=1 Tax=Elsinoe ampelina TaxID=302913 RepID=A0A6A6FYS5_9PEZI|nr:hypothetical protein BDZ85DRAFT_94006 [Elsinoe ampelina]